MTILEGTLSKWTNVMKGWQYRWFVLDENAGLLSYYTSKEKMVKGVRRGCVRLKGAVIGIDDQDVNTFTITVDHKTFHFQAIDADEREKWVRRLEDTILRHASRIRGISDTYCSLYGQSNESSKRPDYLQTLDKRVSEADAYLQLMIEQTAKIEQKLAAQQQPPPPQNSSPQNSLNHSSNSNSNHPLAAGGPSCNSHSVSNSSIGNSKYDETNRRIQDNANAMLDSIKHSIVLLQIAKNTAHPINCIYHGPSAGLHMKSSGGGGVGGALGSAGVGNISGTDLAGLGDDLLARSGVPVDQTGILYGAECLEKGGGVGAGGVGGGGVAVQLLVPETSYSSSEGEDDFFDANDDPYSSEGKANTLNNRTQQQLPQDVAGSGRGADGSASGAAAGAPQSVSTVAAATGASAPPSAASATTAAASTARKASHVSFRHDGSLDYDALYEDECESDLSMESHGNVMTHLLSQVKIGMDLTKVVLPTFILERRSLLEMYADYFAHPDLFLKIVDQKDPRDRMVQVVRWYLSAYHAGRKSAVAKKPYNPIIGEVFRCHWDIPEMSSQRPEAVDGSGAADLAEDGPIPWCRRDQLTFIAEQVSHHPPISAFYAEHCTKRISFAAHVWTKSKFLGLSIGVHNIGQGIVALPDHNEEYILTFPNGYGRSILTVPWIELGGTVTVTCPQTGYHADIDFLTKPFYGGKRNRIAAEVYAPNEKKSFLSVSGEWSGSMEAKWAASAANDAGNRQSQRGPEVFVDVNSIPIFKKIVRPIAEQDEFESRNIWKEVTAGLRLNDIERATNAKSEVEQKQRDEAKGRKDTNAEWETKYFKPVGDGWIYTKSLSQRLLDAKR